MDSVWCDININYCACITFWYSFVSRLFLLMTKIDWVIGNQLESRDHDAIEKWITLTFRWRSNRLLLEITENNISLPHRIVIGKLSKQAIGMDTEKSVVTRTGMHLIWFSHSYMFEYRIHTFIPWQISCSPFPCSPHWCPSRGWCSSQQSCSAPRSQVSLKAEFEKRAYAYLHASLMFIWG